MHSVILFSLVASMSLAAPRAGNANLEEQLRKTYTGTEQFLRHFYDLNTLKFDGQGNPKKESKEGSWTVLGGLLIENVNLKPGKLVFHGRRRLITFDDAQNRIRSIDSDRSVWIEVETRGGPDQPAYLAAALERVFVSLEDLASVLPDYWQDYLARLSGKKTKETACQDSPMKADDAAQAIGRLVQVPTGVVDSLKIRHAAPYYLPVARIHHVTGEVELRVVIDRNGDVSRVCIMRALGAGLDDMMVNTVRQWKYRPYLLNGQPVELEAAIKSKFTMP